jgi:hypothetical protein
METPERGYEILIDSDCEKALRKLARADRKLYARIDAAILSLATNEQLFVSSLLSLLSSSPYQNWNVCPRLGTSTSWWPCMRSFSDRVKAASSSPWTRKIFCSRLLSK